MMKIKFNDYYTSSIKYSGYADGHRFITEISYTSEGKRWAVVETRWIFDSPEDKGKAEKRIKKMVENLYKEDNDREEVSALYERIFKDTNPNYEI